MRLHFSEANQELLKRTAIGVVGGLIGGAISHAQSGNILSIAKGAAEGAIAGGVTAACIRNENSYHGNLFMPIISGAFGYLVGAEVAEHLGDSGTGVPGQVTLATCATIMARNVFLYLKNGNAAPGPGA